jgi:hypothetical protein
MQKQENPNLAMDEIGLARLTLGFLKIKRQNRHPNIIEVSSANSEPLDIGFDIPKRKGLTAKTSLGCSGRLRQPLTRRMINFE